MTIEEAVKADLLSVFGVNQGVYQATRKAIEAPRGARGGVTEMRDDDDISPAAKKAREVARKGTMKRMKKRPAVDLSVPWKLPPLTEIDEFGFPVDGDDSGMIAETNTPDPQFSWRRR
jgi:hypothetical protein